MISEPELEEQWEPGRPAEVAQGAGPPRERGPGRPWRWVVATAVATSAVWAGGLHFYGDRLAAPGLRHRATDNLCEQVKLPALGEALGGLSDTADPHMEGRHPAMDWAMCSRSGSTPAGEDAYFVQAEFELHKKTDPAAEFEVGSKYERAYSDEASVWEPVPGIGEQALISGPGADAEAGADTDRDLRLRVRDGGAVFVLQVVFLGEREPDAQPPEAQDGEAQVPVRPRPDRGTLKAAIVKDMRVMMAALEK
ncbi:hypothetical protein [Streptomyces sp. NBC_01408]|uniref:hypothetical protein n=1 Tax=Streptomyces sp. NBC_01408 TaxID=2903855 RepID=UPI00224EB247|nr:hypothetical protein [Streptomyces sp. NBC_01408]MCX4691271.1 hypothetical protein [Streptomyces sp. NBC_01408]